MSNDFLSRIEKLSPKRLALLAYELQTRLDQAEQARTEPIAIIGLACRFPSAPNSEAFWNLLAEGRDAVVEVPKDRWDIDALYDADPDVPGRVASRWGGFLDRVDQFDAAHFGISRREAISMDPQQRLLLEVCWEALEHAGQSPRGLSGSMTGVFAGISTTDYYGLLNSRGLDSIDTYTATGSAHSVAAGRVAYVLGLHGPNLAIDTSCSSSLVAIHMACQSLRTKECQMAMAGGVNVIATPDVTVALSKGHMMAPDGRCKTFDAAADGFVRGEGCGVVVLKRLSDAQANGDTILAVIRGSAINQDGRSSGITAPNGAAQRQVIRQALQAAKVAPADISYIEAHGTGTSLGDPIEAHALAAEFGGRTEQNPLRVGSVKANFGHLEAAAGVSGLIKIVLSLQHGRIPPQLHFQSMNPHIDWGSTHVDIPVGGREWTPGERPRVAGVSSFGFSGTNAHMIVEEAPAQTRKEPEQDRPMHLLTLSARTDEALRELIARYAERTWESDTRIGDVCFTANTGRSHFPERAAFLASSLDELHVALQAEPAIRGASEGWPKIAFLLTGQGAQAAGMGRELYETEPVFRAALDECAKILEAHLDRNLIDLLYGESSALINETMYTQPVVFALEWALAQTWKSWGIEPTVILGHSVGEYAALCIAGVWTLEDGLKIIAERGKLTQQLSAGWGMSSVQCGLVQVNEARRGIEQWVAIAALNAPESIVVSGRITELAEFETRLTAAGVQVKRLPISHGFHSPQMEEVVDVFTDRVLSVEFRTPRVAVVSSVTGQFVTVEGLRDPDYWRRQLCDSVRFQDAMETLAGANYEVFLEIGPSTTLVALGRQCIGRDEQMWVTSLRRDRGAYHQMVESLGQLYVRGADVDWSGYDAPYQRRRIALPTYPFQRQRYWVEDAPLPFGSRSEIRFNDTTSGTDFETNASEESSAAGQRLQPMEDWFYDHAWRQHSMGSTSGLGAALADGALTEHLGAQATALFTEYHLDRYKELQPQMDALAVAYIGRALHGIGCDFTPGRRFTTAECAETGKVIPQQRSLFSRLFYILADDGCLRQVSQGGQRGDDDTWEVVSRPAADPEPLAKSLLERYTDFRAELSLTHRCAMELAGVLQGTSNPLQLLFPDGSLKILEDLYIEAPAAHAFNTLVRQAVQEAIAAAPAGRRVRILEIGAGTGGTSSFVIPALPADRSEYVFTDVSPLFLSRAKERFAAYPFMRYETLDIEAESDSTDQYDIILAANVVHATVDLRQTLRHVRQRLAPGGLLILLEATWPERWVDLTFGMTDGWWRFRDFDLRPRSALMDRATWLTVLNETGFQDASAVQPAQGTPQVVLLAQASDESLADRWLIAGDTSGIGAALQQRITERGGSAVVIRPGEALSSRLAREDYEHIVYLRGREIPAGTDLEAIGAGESVTMELIEAMQARVKSSTRGRLWIVTQGAQAVSDVPMTMVANQAPLWGLGRTFALEHPEAWGGLCDLDANASDAENAAALMDVVQNPDGEDQCAVRAGMTYVPRVERRALPPFDPATLAFSSTGKYLVTGGLGIIGLRVAEWLVEHGARHLVLNGRTGLPPRSEWDQLSPGTSDFRRVRAMRNMEARGATVTILQADLSHADAGDVLTAAFTPGELRGVFHAAATFDGTLIEQLSAETVLPVLRPKMLGTGVVSDLVRTLGADFLVLFSSTTSLFGSRGMATYAAGNQFQDAFAHESRAKGIPVLSVNWGLWEELGYLPEETRKFYLRAGMHSMLAADTLTALGRVMSTDETQLMVAQIDWTALKGVYQARGRRPLLDEIANRPATSARTNAKSVETPADRLAAFSQLSEPERSRRLAEMIRREAASVLGLGIEEVDPQQGLFDMGMDSLMSVELRARLEKSFNRKFPSTLTFNYPNVQAITGYVAGLIQSQSPSPTPEPAPVPEQLPSRESEPDTRSEDELAAILSSALQSID
ncbi:MAG TPA: type I polyketide synthase [Gemmatimonadaceae bacterium]|nr:type I polyketide synthase [Gemmatimonadaceae bacterium]